MMKRRKFINKTVYSLPYLAFMSSVLSCNDEGDSPISTDKKIIIIGAGMAGLGAAKYFKDRKVEVIVLEAQEKIGGRVRTDRSLGVAFDEGASWIHGPDDNPITSIAQSANANTFLTDDDNVAVFDEDGTEYSDAELDAAEELYNGILDSINGNINQSFEEVFYNQYPQYLNNRLWTFMLSAYLEFDTGGDIGELSSLDFYDDEAFKGKDKIITNGYDKVAEYLAQDIDIRLNTKVTAIDFSNELIQLATDQEAFEADYVLITVPLGVLKQQVISFTPSLSTGIEQSINNLKMGSVNKFLCLWDDPFWNTELQYIGYTGETKGKFNYFLNVKKFANANALMTFAYGEYSKQTEGMTNDEVINEIMDHLKAIYGTGIPAPTNMLRTKWVSNEFAFGSYSFATNGTRSSDFEKFEEPIDNKLFFAGEHTSKDYRGTVHGAYLSGIRGAKSIADLL